MWERLPSIQKDSHPLSNRGRYSLVFASVDFTGFFCSDFTPKKQGGSQWAVCQLGRGGRGCRGLSGELVHL